MLPAVIRRSPVVIDQPPSDQPRRSWSDVMRSNCGGCLARENCGRRWDYEEPVKPKIVYQEWNTWGDGSL